MKIIKRAVLVLFIVFLLFLGLVVVPYFANMVMPWQRAEIIETALTWGGLKELPSNAEVISVETKGSMFNREFIIKFECERQPLENWMGENGLDNSVPTEAEDGLRVYQVAGHEGAIGGKVLVDLEKGKVVIDMSWS